MPVIPEKRELDARVQGALGAQFWGQPVQSGRAVAGTTTTVPCEPPPLSLVAPSGLSRTQLLVAAHAGGLPLFPGYCEEHGGTVSARRRGAACAREACSGSARSNPTSWFGGLLHLAVCALPRAPPTADMRVTTALAASSGAGPCAPAIGTAALVGSADGTAQGTTNDRTAQHAHPGERLYGSTQLFEGGGHLVLLSARPGHSFTPPRRRGVAPHVPPPTCTLLLLTPAPGLSISGP